MMNDNIKFLMSLARTYAMMARVTRQQHYLAQAKECLKMAKRLNTNNVYVLQPKAA
jgi:hypothetical protein